MVKGRGHNLDLSLPRRRLSSSWRLIMMPSVMTAAMNAKKMTKSMKIKLDSILVSSLGG